MKVEGKMTVTKPGTPVGLVHVWASTCGHPKALAWLMRITKLSKPTIDKLEACDPEQKVNPSVAVLVSDKMGLGAYSWLVEGRERRNKWVLNYQADGSVVVEGEPTDAEVTV